MGGLGDGAAGGLEPRWMRPADAGGKALSPGLPNAARLSIRHLRRKRAIYTLSLMPGPLEAAGWGRAERAPGADVLGQPSQQAVADLAFGRSKPVPCSGRWPGTAAPGRLPDPRARTRC